MEWSEDNETELVPAMSGVGSASTLCVTRDEDLPKGNPIGFIWEALCQII